MSLHWLFLGAAAAALSWLLAGAAQRYAVRREVMDLPNARSSHTRPTPRGGGIAIALTTLAALPVLGWMGLEDWSVVWGLSGGGAIVAAIGAVDDHRHIAPQWRLLGHFVAAGWILVWLGGMPPVPLLGSEHHFGFVGYVLAALYLVWLLNLTNFMDGIDGIAGVEGITVCLGGVLSALIAAPGSSQWLVPLVLAAATAGFLVWNWPPAKIFMGDSGSGFLGLMLAALSLQAGWLAPRLFWSWAVLLGVFVVDATVTLIRRVARGDRFYEAHRSHAYQHAAQLWGAHRPVTISVGVINLCWLLPLAVLVARGSLDGSLGVMIAYLPIIIVTVVLGAGA